MDIALSLINNATLVFALCFAQRYFSRHWEQKTRLTGLITGLMYGGSAIAAMAMAYPVSEGLFFDSRTVLLSMGALFGGPIVAGLSAVIAGIYRLYLGGAGVYTGILTITTAIAMGLAFRHVIRGQVLRLTIFQILGFGLAVHIACLLWFPLLPIPFIDIVLKKLALPFVGLLSLATLAMGLLLKQVQEMSMFESILNESHDRFKRLFDSTAAAVLEEDVSQVYRSLDRFRMNGITDLRAHLQRNPDLVDRLISGVHVVNANPSALTLFGVESVATLNTHNDRFFGSDARGNFIDVLGAFWRGDERFQAETTYKTADGRIVEVLLALPLPKSEVAARHVPVSFLDVTGQRQMEREAARERLRLQEVLWGTNVGTWEWNIQTGETRFNERWAEIIGYTLAELQPTTIQTWSKLAHPDDLAKSNAIIEEVFSGKRDFYECEARMRAKDGTWIWVLDRGKVVAHDDQGHPLRMSGTHMDITHRKQAEAESERLTAVRETLLRCHAEILRATNEADLLNRTLETVVEARGYSLAWYGIPEEGGEKRIRPIAQAGPARAYLDGLAVHWSEDSLGQGPSGRAVRTGLPQVTERTADDAGFEPWAARAARHGFKSSVAVPMKIDGKVAAVLNIYSSEDGAFGKDELALITEFADNLALAVRTLRLQFESAQLHSSLEDSAMGAVRAIASTIEKRDPYTSGHQVDVATLAVAIGRKLGWDRFKLEGLKLGATIHDIGKISVPAEILNRPGRLTESEFGVIKAHPQTGFEILEKTDFPWPIKEMVVQHHERIDGTGYPYGLKGDEIIDEAKVLAVADVVDAITSHRPYRPGRGIDVALAEIERGRGTAYDPSAVDACLSLLRDEHFQWAHAGFGRSS